MVIGDNKIENLQIRIRKKNTQLEL